MRANDREWRVVRHRRRFTRNGLGCCTGLLFTDPERVARCLIRCKQGIVPIKHRVFAVGECSYTTLLLQNTNANRYLGIFGLRYFLQSYDGIVSQVMEGTPNARHFPCVRQPFTSETTKPEYNGRNKWIGSALVYFRLAASCFSLESTGVAGGMTGTVPML